MNIRKTAENIVFKKMWPTCFKLTLLLGGLGFFLGALVIGPLTHKPDAYDIRFTDEDRAQFKANELENLERGLEYFGSDNMVWAVKQHLNEQIEKRTCIPFSFRYKEDFRNWARFEKAKEGKRKGKVSSKYHKQALDSAINRTIDEVSWRNFNGGYLMKTSSLDSIGARYWSDSPDGYSIVTGGWAKFSYCKNYGIGLAVAGFLLPIVFILGVSLLFFPVIGICRCFSRWIKWTFSEFFR